jgi:hypothetical protein
MKKKTNVVIIRLNHNFMTSIRYGPVVNERAGTSPNFLPSKDVINQSLNHLFINYLFIVYLFIIYILINYLFIS